MNTQKTEGLVYFTLFIGSIFMANYLIQNIGVICPEDSPCLIPVWPGVMAPSGILAVGIAFTLRDLLQRRLGLGFTFAAIVLGAGISVFISPSLALASGTAFFLSETFDLLVYTPLQKRNLFMAVILSNIVGLVVDSIVFLWLAFRSFQFIEGQIIGKLWMTLLALPAIWLIRQWDAKRELGIEGIGN